MEAIDARWIEARLSGRRGELAELARALGVEPHVVSKIRAGTRLVKASEAPIIQAFFEGQEPPHDDVKRRLHLRIEELTVEEARYLLGSADTLIAHRPEEAE